MSPKLKKFVDRLPIPKTQKPKRKSKKGTYYEMEMVEFKQKLHRDLRPTSLWGYNGRFPGPILDVNQCDPIQVKWMNRLPAKHLLPIDQTIHGVMDQPEVRTVTHLHGGETQSSSDGIQRRGLRETLKK